MEETATTPSPVPPQGVDGFPSPTRSSNLPVRILGRNVNGTVVQTSMPQNEAELQLYRVMQRASLLSYYDTLLEMGGDDVQQLCDAGEEEFLEIMALVGMASKPLHVRRLQKALQEWLTNPGMFQSPVVAPPGGSKTPTITTPVVFTGFGSYSPTTTTSTTTTTTTRQPGQVQSAVTGAAALSSIASQSATGKIHAASSGATPPSLGSCLAASPVIHTQFSPGCCPVQQPKSLTPPPPATFLPEPANSAPTPTHPVSHSPGIVQVANYESSSCGSQGTTPSPNSNSTMMTGPQSPTTGLQTTPILLESQVQRLAEAAERLAATLRPLNPKPQSGIKKKMCKNLEMVMAMPETDPRRMEEIRKFAAIYGRFDCKRKPEKPLTLHEVSVNEAAAQICRFVPALLTRRDELFPLARRVVRDSGHYHIKGLVHSSSNAGSGRLRSSRENGEGELSGGEEPSILTSSSTGGIEAAVKRRKLELRCEDDSVAGNRENPAESTQHQGDNTRTRCSSYSRGALAIDSDSNSIKVQRNRHRKRQRRRRPSKIEPKSISSLVWQSCSENSSIVLDGVVEDLDDSDGCYSSFEDDWDDCNDEDCEDNFPPDSDPDGEGEDRQDDPALSMAHEVQNRTNNEEDDVSCMMDKENDFNLKVIASCGDNIIAVANPALMNRNQPTAITKEQPIKEEITLRDRRD